MKRLVFFVVFSLFGQLAVAQDGEIIEAQRRVAIISVGSEQGLQKSDTLWVSDVSDKKDHLVAKATVIALRKRYAAIEAFQYFGAYRLAVGQRVYRVKDLPAPLTAPPQKTSGQTQKPDLTLSDVHQQRLRVFVFAGGVKPLGGLGNAFAESISGGAGVHLAVIPSLPISLSGRYIFLRHAAASQNSLDALGLNKSSSLLQLSATIRPWSRFVMVEVGPAIFQSHETLQDAAATTSSTFYDAGVVAGIGKYFKLNDRFGWMFMVSLHNYFPDIGVRNFVTVDLQLHF